MNYYASDIHFGLESIIEKENRPFLDINEMNNTIIENINKKVKKNDTLYIGGDVGCYTFNSAKLLKKIECRDKRLIIGNHDTRWLKHRDFKDCFTEIVWQKIIYDGDYKILLSHFPQAEWDGYFKGILHFYGHVHKSKIGGAAYMSLLPNAFNIGMDVNDFEPKTAEELISKKQISDLTMKQLKKAIMIPDNKEKEEIIWINSLQR